MKTFLIVFGAFVAAMAFVILVFYFWIRAKLRGFARKVESQFTAVVAAQGVLAPPFRMSLEAQDSLEWDAPEAVEAWRDTLKKRGFQPVGRYQADTRHDLCRLEALVHPDEAIYAVVLEMDSEGVWCDLVTLFRDGTAYTCSSARRPGLDRPPGKELERIPDADADTLLDHFLANRPDGPKLAAEPKRFVECFERFHAEEMDWHLARGGPTAQEIHQVISNAPDEDQPINNEQVVIIQHMWRGSLMEDISDQLRESFLRRNHWTLEQWENDGDRLVYIHDAMGPGELTECFEALWDDDLPATQVSAEGIEKLLDDNLSPRKVFARIDLMLPENLRFEKVAVLADPIEAEVYLQSEDVEYDEEEEEEEE